ncbi:MAG: transcription antitermination factor NusB, partial [Gammaproteobacteria bacterium]
LVQAYYQWLLTQGPVLDIIKEFKADRRELQKADMEYFDQVLQGMVASREAIDQELSGILDRADKELDPVENAVLHLGAYEIMYMPDIPCRVVINEAVDLARMFGADQSHKYINGVLDKLARKFRVVEFTNRR